MNSKGIVLVVILLFASLNVILSTRELIFDEHTTPPVTILSLNPPESDGDNGWYLSDVAVTLNATDDITNITENKNDSIESTTNNINEKEIRVAIFSKANVHFPTADKFIKILNGYQWMVGNTIYKFITIRIYDKEIRKGKLTIDNYDLFIIPAMEGEELLGRMFFHPLSHRVWKKNVMNFIKSGGGYIGYCMGSVIITGIDGKPTTFVTKIIDKLNLGISNVKLCLESSIPFLPSLSGKPEKIGPAAYQWYSGWNETSTTFCGCPLDVDVNRDNPIFDDYLNDKRRISWNSGPSFVLPDDGSNSNITVLANYPETEISKNLSTQIHAWKYKGKLAGFLKGFKKSKELGESFSDILYFTPFLAGDWEITDKIIETHNAGKPLMTMETYPNENQGRIVLCAAHPEFKVWWGGHIEEKEDTKNNNLFDALHYWTDIIPFNQTLEDEERYNHWIVRRHAAWSGKIADNDLPPVYGPSQVSDIYPYEQPFNFTVLANVESSDGIISIDLFYRYSYDNNSWTNWTLYKTDSDSSDGWSWKFNASERVGYYQFYSIRTVEFEGSIEIENAPPGPDAEAYIYVK